MYKPKLKAVSINHENWLRPWYMNFSGNTLGISYFQNLQFKASAFDVSYYANFLLCYQIVNPKIKSYLYSIRAECYCKYLLQMYILSTHLLKYTTYILHEFCILNIMYHGNFAHGKVLFNYPWI